MVTKIKAQKETTMKRLYGLLLMLLLALPIQAAQFFPAVCLTGGTTGCIDKIDGATVNTGDVVFYVSSSGEYRTYVLISDNATDDGDLVIAPDANAGTKRWHLVSTKTDKLFGRYEIISDDTSLSDAQCQGSIDVLNGSESVTLPAAKPGMSIVLYSDDATVKVITPASGENIWLNGVDNGDNNTIQSPGAIGNFLTLVCFTTGNWYTMGMSGVWIDTP